MFPRRWHDTGKCGDIASHIPEWVEQGARWIGEYCGATSTEMGLSIGSSLSLLDQVRISWITFASKMLWFVVVVIL